MKHNSKIIVCGWWFDKFDNQENQTDFIDQLNLPDGPIYGVMINGKEFIRNSNG